MPERSLFLKFPFVRIVLFFLLGILFSKQFLVSDTFVLALIFVLLIFFTSGWKTSKYNFVSIQNRVLPVLVITVGIYYAQIFREQQLVEMPEEGHFIAEVCQKPTEKQNSFQTMLKVKNDSVIHDVKVLAYFSKSNFDTTINSGDILKIYCKMQKINNMGNPFEFDYKSMMNNRNVFFTSFIQSDKIIKTGLRINTVEYFAENLRENLLKILNNSIPEIRERSVISALTLGYRTELDRDTKDYFATTGAMHVLAVSGLHVGLIYFIICFFFNWVQKVPFGAFIFPFIVISVLWLYALITGFSPSVQRATVMFTFVVIGNSIRRPVNIYNSLSASAVVLILMQPNVIYEVGYQLSYIAVFGIVLIQPKISKIFIIKNKILKFFWDLLTVSIAAQLATFPLGLFYFNQFPNYFWISNFLVIPGATIIIWLTSALFILHKFELLADIISNIIEAITKLMINSLKFISELPNALSDGIIIGRFQLIMIYIILVFIIVFIFSKNKIWIYNALITIVLLQISLLSNNLGLLKQKQIIVYNSKTKIIHYINGRNNYLVTENETGLSYYEELMVKNVIENLKLNEPVIFNQENKFDFVAGDIIADNKNIVFINSITNFNKSSSLKFSKENKLIVSFTNNPKVYTSAITANDNSYSTYDQVFEIKNKQCYVFSFK